MTTLYSRNKDIFNINYVKPKNELMKNFRLIRYNRGFRLMNKI